MDRLTLWSVFCLALLLLWQLPVQAIDNIRISIGNWSSKDLAAQGFELDMKLTAAGLILEANAAQLNAPDPINQLKNVSLRCKEMTLLSGQIQCQQGTLGFQHPRLGKQLVDFSLTSQPERNRHQLQLSGLQLAGTPVSLSVSLQQSTWQAELKTGKVMLQALSEWLTPWLNDAQQAMLADWDYQGQLAIAAKLQGKANQLSQIELNLHSDELNLANQQGNYVTEAVSGDWKLLAKQSGQEWQWQSHLQIDNGQAYAEPVFLDFAANAVNVNAQGSWQQQKQSWLVEQLDFEQQDVISAQAALTLQQNQLTRLDFKTEPADLSALYPVWLQPFLLGNAAGKLDATGKVVAELELESGEYQLRLNAEEVSVKDQENRFQIEGLSGKLGWTNGDDTLDSSLRWQQADVYAVTLGAAEIKAQSHANGLKLQEGLNLPVLDGALMVNAFTLQQQADQHVNWTFEGLLTPVSMEALSEALGWPLLHGKLSGVIPKVSYSGQQITVDGALQVKLFDGVTVIRDLRMSSPLGSLPQLYANIDMNNIDMELLTSTFDFGKITGRLDGQVHNLRLSDWKPVQFDARFATSVTEPGKRRISQRAVDNLSQIGGGATGVLSRSFLRFFEDFAYQRLGLSCRLRNDVCEMAGVEEAEQGYYIVKGGGGLPPWINVVGYTRRVDWADLIERLKAVSESSGPVIQ